MRKKCAEVNGANPASIWKNERAGYKVEAVFREKFLADGRYVDGTVVSISQEEFFQLYPVLLLEKV